MTKAQHLSESVEHFSPAYIVEAARYTLGEIDFDPASCEFANKLVKAKRICTLEDGDDGLAVPWRGRIFCNPPGRSATNLGGAAAWWAKCDDEFMKSRGDMSCIFVGFSLELLQTVQSWDCTHPLAYNYCIPKKRIKFDRSVKEWLTLVEKRIENPNQRDKSGFKEDFTLRDYLIDCLRSGVERVPGKSPTHGNVIVCVTDSNVVKGRFRAAFSEVGVCR